MRPTPTEIDEEVDRLILRAGVGQSAGELENLADSLEREARRGSAMGELRVAAVLELRKRVLKLRGGEPPSHYTPRR